MMDERIKELARTAEREVQISLGERWTTVGRAEFMRLYNEKFAELIVRECADWIKSLDESEHPTAWLLCDELKEHFGIE